VLTGNPAQTEMILNTKGPPIIIPQRFGNYDLSILCERD
jgi:hypothetical protein